MPERCERFRESASRRLDGALSTFEAALLERHLGRCAACRSFTAAVRAQTELLRAAPLVRPVPPVIVGATVGARLRRRAAVAVGAVAVAATAAVLAFTPVAAQTNPRATEKAVKLPLVVVGVKPSVEATFDVPRLQVVPPPSRYDAVRGYYGVPA